jgi:hypothetical protein
MSTCRLLLYAYACMSAPVRLLQATLYTPLPLRETPLLYNRSVLREVYLIGSHPLSCSSCCCCPSHATAATTATATVTLIIIVIEVCQQIGCVSSGAALSQ